MPAKRKKSYSTPTKASKRRKQIENQEGYLGDGYWEVDYILEEDEAKGFLIKWKGVDPLTKKEYPVEWIPRGEANEQLVAAWESEKKKRKTHSPQPEIPESQPSTPRRTPRTRQPSRRIVESSPSTAANSTLGPPRPAPLITENSPTSGRGGLQTTNGDSVKSFTANGAGKASSATSESQPPSTSGDSPVESVAQNLQYPDPEIEPVIEVPQQTISQFNPDDFRTDVPTQYRSSPIEEPSPAVSLITEAADTQEESNPNAEDISSIDTTIDTNLSEEGVSELVPNSQEIAETQPESLLRRFGNPVEWNTQRVIESSLIANKEHIQGPRDDDSTLPDEAHQGTEKEDGSLSKASPVPSAGLPAGQFPDTNENETGPSRSSTSGIASQSSKGPGAEDPSIDFTQGTINASTSSGSQVIASQDLSNFATQLPFEPTQESLPQVLSIDRTTEQGPATSNNTTTNRSLAPSGTRVGEGTTDQSVVQRTGNTESIAREATFSLIDQALASVPKGNTSSSPLPPPTGSLENTSNPPPRPRTPSTMSTPTGLTPASVRRLSRMSEAQRESLNRLANWESRMELPQVRALRRLHRYGEALPEDFPDEWRHVAENPETIPDYLAELTAGDKRYRDKEYRAMGMSPSPDPEATLEPMITSSEAVSQSVGLSNRVTSIDEVSNSQLEPTMVDVTPSVAKLRQDLDFYLPLPLIEDQRMLYIDTLRYHRETIEEFLSSTGNQVSEEMISKIKDVIQQLYNYSIHPDLADDGTWTQKEETLESQARWHVKASSKFRLLKAFFDTASVSEKHVVIVAKPGRYMDLLENFLRGIDITYHRPDQHRQYSSSRSPLKVTILQSGFEGSRAYHSSAHLVIGFDETFAPDDSQVRQVRRRIANHDLMCPMVCLVVVSSVEHLGRRLLKGLPETERLRTLLTQACKLRKQVGVLTDSMLEPQDLGEVFGAALLSDDDRGWQLSAIQNVEFPPLDAIQEPPTKVSTPGEDAMATTKRHLGEPVSPTMAKRPAKRPRTSTLQDDEDFTSSSTNRITDSNIASTTTEAQTIIHALEQQVATLNIANQQAEARAVTAEERIIDIDKKAKEHINSLEVALHDLQTRFEDQTRDNQAKTHKLALVQTAFEGDKAKIETLRNNNSTLKAQIAQLRTELAEARQAPPAEGATTATNSTTSSEEMTAALRKAEKRNASLTTDLDFFRAQYQAASTSAVEAANRVKELESENANLQTSSSGTKIQLRTLYEKEAVKRANEGVERLEKERQSLQKAMERMVDENKRLKEKESRKGMAANTRASSLPPGAAPPGLHASIRSALGGRSGGGGGGAGSRSKGGSRQGSRQPSPKPGSNDKVGVGKGSGAVASAVDMARSVSQGSGTTSARGGQKIQLHISRPSHLRE